MSKRRPVRVLAWVVAVVLVVSVGGFAAYYAGYFDDSSCDDGSCKTQDALPPRDLNLVRPVPDRPVLAAADGPAASTTRVRAAVLPLLRSKALGSHVGFAVMDLSNGDHRVWSYGGGSFAPASTLKLFTSTAALRSIDPQKRFATTVTRSGRRITLIGGGDPYLTGRPSATSRAAYPRRAALSTLADRTAAALRAKGVTSVRLAYDDTLFTGPSVNPRWPPQYISSYVTTPVSALWIDQGVVGYRRTATPARDAADAFAGFLTRRGVKVHKSPVHASAGSQPQIAAVQSGTLAQIVQSLIERSDNQAAEVVLRHVAIAAGKPASFAGGTSAVRAVLTRLGVPLAGTRIYDGSGLARSDRVTTASMLGVLQHADLLYGFLPVAGFNGSLTSRFTSPGTAPGLGVVRAKTGTLTGVHGLAGLVVDARGTSLAFVAMTDKVKVRKTLAARAMLDRIASRLARCACSSAAPAP